MDLWNALHHHPTFWSHGRFVAIGIVVAIIVVCALLAIAEGFYSVKAGKDEKPEQTRARARYRALWQGVAAAVVLTLIAVVGFLISWPMHNSSEGWMKAPIAQYVQDQYGVTALGPVQLTREGDETADLLFGYSGELTGAELNAVKANGDIVGVRVTFRIPLSSDVFDDSRELPAKIDWLTVDIDDEPIQFDAA